MAELDLNIILKLVDKASADLQKIKGQATKTSEDVAKASESANNAISDSAKKTTENVEKQSKKQRSALGEFSKSIRAFRQELFAIAGVSAFVIASMNEFARVNKEARKSLDETQLAVKNVFVLYGKIFDAYSPLAWAMKKFGTQINDSFGNEQLNNIIRAENELKNFNQELKDISSQFVSGKMSGSDYFDALLKSQDSVIYRNMDIKRSFDELANLQTILGDRELLEARTRTQEQINLLNFYKSEYEKAHAGMAAFTVTIGESIQTNLSSALTDVVTGAKDAEEAFSMLGQAMIRTVVDFMAQKLVAFALEKTLLATTVATTSAAASALAAAWLPAATFASIATLGGASASGVSALGAASAASIGILTTFKTSVGALNNMFSGVNAADIGKKHDGGMIVAHSGLAVDEVPIIAQSGEGILSRRGMANLGGAPVLNALNRGESRVGGNVSVVVNYPRMTSKEEVSELAKVLGAEINRQLRYSRGF
jgi:hypothetical protein